MNFYVIFSWKWPKSKNFHFYGDLVCFLKNVGGGRGGAKGAEGRQQRLPEGHQAGQGGSEAPRQHHSHV